MKYYLTEELETTGPFSVPELEELYAAKQISGDTLACPDDGTEKWKPLYRLVPHFDPSPERVEHLKQLVEKTGATSLDRPVDGRTGLGWCLVIFGGLGLGFFCFFYDTTAASVGTQVHNFGFLLNRLIGVLVCLTMILVGALALLVPRPAAHT